ncbi:SOS response-associated peptidase [Paenibacillus sp. N1-5-1-14]|uniref:SOS response-associated peptidase n=1 Tax=Paenibacillus radicibacter TaxID=2972488 RepID=UPI00215933FA|nr:SOS response-associated peptidase [Paenibacillus radicibacter]MCR8641805.1 SOS response-associated peptidase [Paenibacillus radicibacter]
MCGRYTITVTEEELMLRFSIYGDRRIQYEPRYNIAPGQLLPAIINDGQHNRLGPLKWGLVPNWAKDEKVGFQMINARAETLLDKPAFRVPLLRKRCMIPADGFYDWQQLGRGKEKQPMRIVMKSRSLFAMAGLYDMWVAEDGRKVSSCTIITTSSNPVVAPIHDRMPVILQPEHEQLWLDRDMHDVAALQKVLVPFPAADMQAYPVSPQVGKVANDNPSLIEPCGMDTLF